MVWYLIEHRIQNDDVKILNVLMSGITDKMNDKPHDKSNMDTTCLSSFNILTAPATTASWSHCRKVIRSV